MKMFARPSHNSKLRKLERRKIGIKTWMPILVRLTGIIGFAMGVLLGVHEVLYFHGPTVTAGGTILACAIYLAIGTGFGWFFAWIARLEIDEQYDKTSVAIEQLHKSQQIQ